MAVPARFGKPAGDFSREGSHIAVHLFPVYEGRLVAFDVPARQARGRWLPWDLLPFRGNPYETASALGDDWCDGAVTSLHLVDAISLVSPGESWELALVFRAELAEMPGGDADRVPVPLAADELAGIHRFEPVDLARWLDASAPAISESPAPRRERRGDLLF